MSRKEERRRKQHRASSRRVDNMDNNAIAIVLDALQRAASQNGEILKPAEQQLQSWEKEEGFYTVLMKIFSDKEIDHNARWIAILYLKNGVDRYWRRHSVGAIKEEEKAGIKSMLLSNFHEPVNQLAMQLAVLIGKVARLDCPRLWPGLLPALIEAITTVDDELKQQRILLSFYQVIKCLSSKRLAHDRKVFEELTHNIFDFVLNLWNTQMSRFDEHLSQNNLQNAHVMLEYAHLTLKVLRKLVVYGFKDPRDQESVSTFIQQIFFGISSIAEAGKKLPELTTMSNMWNKMLILYSKILLDMLMYHAELYVEYITSSLEMICKFCFTDDGLLVSFERFNVNLLNLMKDILKNTEYKPPTLKANDENNAIAMKAYNIIRTTMTPETLVRILKVLVYRYLPLTASDLEVWECDPEEYVNEEGGDSYKYSMKACVETLYVTLFKEYKCVVTPVLLEMVQQSNSTPCDPVDMSALLNKEALYNAVGLAAYDIYDDVDFDSWLSNQLVNELKISHSKVVKRRVIWLIGNWVTVKLSVSARPVVYSAILSLLAEQEDLVVRMEAALTLKAAVDDFEFSYDQFSPYMEPSFHLLFKLLTDVESCDSKMQVLHVMSFLIERAGSHIAPHCQTLIHYLPMLWQESEGHHLLRCAIVTTLANLVQGLGEESSQLASIVVPVIQLSTDMNQDAHIYLLEDGLHLWQAVLYHNTQISPGVLELFPALPPIVDMSTENLRICLKIIEAYTLLCGQRFMSTYGTMLVDCLCSLVTDIKSEGLILIMKTVEIFFKLFSRQACHLFKNLITSWIIPNILDGESYPMVMSMYLSIISRITFEDYHLFLTYISEFSLQNNKQEGEVLTEILQIWFEKLDCISHSERRKLCALAISNLIPTSMGATVEGLDPMVNACVQVMHDVCSKVTEDGQLLQVDSVLVDPADADKIPESEFDSAHEKRKHQLSFKDPLFHVRLDSYIWSKLNQLRAMVGDAVFQQLMANIDPDITAQLQDFMKPHMQA